MSNTYCPMPWINISLTPELFQPCCMWDDFPAFAGIKSATEMQSSEKLKSIKEDMLAGRPVSGCTQCYNDEKLGLESPRQQAIKNFGIVTESIIKSLDLALNNVCNIKCRGCMSANSHLLYDDELKLYGQTIWHKKYTTAFDIDDIDLDNLERIDLSGGEPLLNKQVDIFFKKLIDKDLLKNIHLSCNTNGTVEPSDVMKEVFQNVKDLTMNISIDGIAELNTYFRSGADWQKCLKSFEEYDKLYDTREGHTVVAAHTTVSIYNVNVLNDIESFFKTNFPRMKNTRRLLYWPEFLSIKNVPQDLKDLIAPTVTMYPEIAEFLSSEGKDLFEHFLNFHNGLDNIRKETLSGNDLLSNYIETYQQKNPVRVDSKPYWPEHIKILIKQ